ncbi:hypothetical protein FA13DRAFT_1771101 [Coprinellus micaceus]|uniref:Uncharacterized protein n=1 Tax=Coprinellus micaceus TaxID=71717 RepID=A0A4Y7TUP3_COPMI|nr:hypothetical protein FA13DRAFT_1771101 [Coprinellus micaceus]
MSGKPEGAGGPYNSFHWVHLPTSTRHPHVQVASMLHPDDLSRLLNGNDTPNAVESASIRQDLGNLKVQIASPGNPTQQPSRTRTHMAGEIGDYAKDGGDSQRLWVRNWISAIQFATGPTPWDSLQSLHLAFSEETRWNDSPKASRSIFRHLPSTLTAPHLQLPSVTRAFREKDDTYEARSSTRLKSLALFCDWHGMHVFDMLQHCTDLETLQLDTDSVLPWEGLEAAEELMENRLKVPMLRTLRFRRAAGIDFLDCVRAPALRHLDLGCTTAEAAGELDEEFAENP